MDDSHLHNVLIRITVLSSVGIRGNKVILHSRESIMDQLEQIYLRKKIGRALPELQGADENSIGKNKSER